MSFYVELPNLLHGRNQLWYNKYRKSFGGSMYQVALFFMRFLILSVIGYFVEMITCAIVEKRWTNRGFFCGPIIPVYGIGCLLLSWVLSPFKNYFQSLILNIFFIAFLGMILTTSLEYITGYLLEKIFHNKWWDYSKEKFNLHGRICLKNMLLFALASPIVVYLGDPIITYGLLQIKDHTLILIANILFAITLLDVIYSCVVAYKLRSQIIIVHDLKNQKLAKIPGMLEKMVVKRLKTVKSIPKRLLHTFPFIQKQYAKEIALLEKVFKYQEKKRKKK